MNSNRSRTLLAALLLLPGAATAQGSAISACGSIPIDIEVRRTSAAGALPISRDEVFDIVARAAAAQGNAPRADSGPVAADTTAVLRLDLDLTADGGYTMRFSSTQRRFPTTGDGRGPRPVSKSGTELKGSVLQVGADIPASPTSGSTTPGEDAINSRR